MLNKEHQIVSVTDANTYTFTATATANSSDTNNGGSSTVAKYQINTGTNFYIDSTGWGVGGWGESAWGQAVDITVTNQLRLFSQDAFGDDLIFNARGGGVFSGKKVAVQEQEL